MTEWREKWLPILVAVLPGFFPLYLFKGTWFGFPVNLLEVLVLVLFLLFVFTERLWEPQWWARYASQYKIVPIFLFGIAAVVSVFFAQQGVSFLDGTVFDGMGRALGILKGWILMPMLYFFMARHVFSERPSLVSLSLDALLMGGVALALMAIQQELSGEFLTADGRASGPFESANYLSLYLGPMVVYGVLQSLQSGVWDFQRSSRVFLTIIAAVGLYFTESYAAWIAVLGALSLWVLFSFKKLPKRWRPATMLLLLSVLVSLIFLQVGSDKFVQFLDLAGRSSSSVRLQVYEISLTLVAQHPFFGLGLGGFEWFYQDQAVKILGEAPFEWVMLHPHNVFLSMWLNLGLLGLVAFVWLCVKALAWLFEADKKGRRVAAFMLVSILIHGLFDTPYFKNDLAFEFWLLMAILL